MSSLSFIILQLSLSRDKNSALVDVTGQNLIIAAGQMSSASNIVKVTIKDNLMITVDSNDDMMTKPRDTIRIWRRKPEDKTQDTAHWKQDTYIERSHVSLISDIKIIE